MRANSTGCTIAVYGLAATTLVSRGNAQALHFNPPADSVTVVTGGDIGPALMYSLDTSNVGFDSIKVFAYGDLFAASADSIVQIPYCTFVAQDSQGNYEYHLWFVLDPPYTPERTEISRDQFTAVYPGRGYLSLVAKTFGIASDSLGVRCIVKFVAGIEQEEPHPSSIQQIQLMQNYPNPFNAQTSITYSLPPGANYSLDLYNSTGQELGTISHGQHAGGTQVVHFASEGLSSGVYYLRLRSRNRTQSVKMIVLR